jgi:hypothetical protein
VSYSASRAACINKKFRSGMSEFDLVTFIWSPLLRNLRRNGDQVEFTAQVELQCETYDRELLP